MTGSIIVAILLLTCLAEGMARGHPQRAAQLRNLRLLIVIVWVGWAVQNSWNDSSLTSWFVFDDLVASRLFQIAFLGVVLWLAGAGLLKSRLAVFRTALITANMVVSTVFALIMGATVDWAASSPFVFVFIFVNLAVLAGVTWQIANSGLRNRRVRAENAEART